MESLGSQSQQSQASSDSGSLAAMLEAELDASSSADEGEGVSETTLEPSMCVFPPLSTHPPPQPRPPRCALALDAGMPVRETRMPVTCHRSIPCARVSLHPTSVLAHRRRPPPETGDGSRKRRRTDGAAAAGEAGAEGQTPEKGLLPAPEARAPNAGDRCPPHPGFIRGMCIRCGGSQAEGAAAESVALRRDLLAHALITAPIP